MTLPAYKIHHILDYFTRRMARRILSAETPTDRISARFPDLTAHRDVIQRISRTIMNDIHPKTERDGEATLRPEFISLEMTSSDLISSDPASSSDPPVSTASMTASSADTEESSDTPPSL